MTNQKANGERFGHPPALPFLFATEMWERFSYYGMRALLVLYMVKYLLVPERAETVWGLAAFKQALEAVFGPLGPQPSPRRSTASTPGSSISRRSPVVYWRIACSFVGNFLAGWLGTFWSSMSRPDFFLCWRRSPAARAY